MLRYLSFVASILLATSSFSQTIPLINSGTVIANGKNLYDSGKYEEAINEFYKVSERDTNYVLMLTEAALTWIAAEKYDKVLPVCDIGLAKPSAYTPYFLRYQAIAEDKLGNFDKSVDLFLKAIKKFPADFGMLYNLGVTFYNNKEYEKAAEQFFNVLAINPFHSGSHLNLGRIAIGQGRKVHGMLSMGMYLSISNTDNARLVLLNNFLDNQVTDEGSIPLFGSNEPEKLDQIIRAKIAMDKKFKSAFPVDAAVVTQFEMFFQQMQTIGEETDDPWIRSYLPIYQYIRDQDLIEPFIYHILSSASNTDVKKWLSKNNKSLKSFFTSVNTAIRTQREVVSLESFGNPKPVQAWYNNDNTLNALGEYTADEIRKGHWQFFYDNYTLSAEGDYNSQGKKTGTWKYYNNDGTLKSIEDYNTGEITLYHPNGTKREHFFLRDDKIHGDVELYFRCGPIKEKLTYLNGDRHGKGQSYHATGGVDLSYEYVHNKANGEFKTFYPDGSLKTVAIYKNDDLNGNYQSYHANEKLQSRGQYREGFSVGSWSYYYSNGKKERMGSFNDSGGPLGEWVYYSEQGLLTEKRQFDDEGRLHGHNTHYFEDKVHYVDTYEKDVLIQSVFYDRTGKEISRQGNPDGNFAVRNYFGTGQLQSEGSYKSGKAHGPWKYYNRFGKLISEYTYADGLLQGKGAEYFASGARKYSLEYKDNALHGYFQEFYQHGPVKQEGWFDHGNREQRWLTYFTDGTPETDGFYLRNSFTGPYYTYSPDSKLHSTNIYENGALADIKNYDSKGNLLTRQTVDQHIQSFEDRFQDTKPSAKFDLLCGSYVNDFTKWYPDGTLYYSVKFQDGKKYGPYAHNNANGIPAMEGSYMEDTPEGPWKVFNFEGTLIQEGRYLNGLQDSVWKFYYPHGSLNSTITYRKDDLHGVARYFSPEGEPLVEKMFVGGDLIAYRHINQNEEDPAWQDFSGTGTISLKNSAGKVVYEETYQEGMRHGYKRIYYNDGNLCEEYRYHLGDFEGPYRLYYPNGKVAENGNFKNDVLDGKVESFRPDGTPSRTEHYSMGTRHGKATYYKGRIRKDYTFWDGMIE